MIDSFSLIIGSAKSGTSSLFNYLAEHPEVAPSSKKETQFFSEAEVFGKGFNYYQSLWNWNHEIHRTALEATPNYTRSTHNNLLNAAVKIAEIQQQLDLEFKFIYIMRDPIARIESHYTHLEAWGQEPGVAPFAEGIEDEIIDVSKYAMQLDEYYQRFKSDQILLLKFEDLTDNPALVLRKVCRFLEIDDRYQFKTLDKVYNSNQGRKKVFLPGWNAVRQTSVVKNIARTTPVPAKEIFRNLFGKKVRQKIELSYEDKTYVLSRLQDDLQKLRQEYQVDISRWDIPQSVSIFNQL